MKKSIIMILSMLMFTSVSRAQEGSKFIIPSCSPGMQPSDTIKTISFGTKEAKVSKKIKAVSNLGFMSQDIVATWVPVLTGANPNRYVKEVFLDKMLYDSKNKNIIAINSMLGEKYTIQQIDCIEGKIFVCYINESNVSQDIVFIYSKKDKELQKVMKSFECSIIEIFGSIVSSRR